MRRFIVAAIAIAMSLALSPLVSASGDGHEGDLSRVIGVEDLIIGANYYDRRIVFIKGYLGPLGLTSDGAVYGGSCFPPKQFIAIDNVLDGEGLNYERGQRVIIKGRFINERYPVNKKGHLAFIIDRSDAYGPLKDVKIVKKFDEFCRIDQ